jgi:hypothetical protein
VADGGGAAGGAPPDALDTGAGGAEAKKLARQAARAAEAAALDAARVAAQTPYENKRDANVAKNQATAASMGITGAGRK